MSERNALLGASGMRSPTMSAPPLSILSVTRPLHTAPTVLFTHTANYALPYEVQTFVPVRETPQLCQRTRSDHSNSADGLYPGSAAGKRVAAAL
jgi:hypothetical protein